MKQKVSAFDNRCRQHGRANPRPIESFDEYSPRILTTLGQGGSFALDDCTTASKEDFLREFRYQFPETNNARK